jgi:hypothetical protein
MHVLSYKPSGAECSCGKNFNIWAWPSTTGYNAHNRRALACANARRHANAANEKEESK